MSTLTVADELDLCGEVCPFLLVRAKRALEALPAGGRLRVVFDYPPARSTLPRWAQSAGHAVADERELEPGRWGLTLVRGENADVAKP